MKRCVCLVLAAIAALASCSSAVRAADRPPNVVFFLIDDLGWTDLGCFGSDLYETPHIDRLAKEGMKFSNGYSACTVCSPACSDTPRRSGRRSCGTSSGKRRSCSGWWRAGAGR